MIRKVKFKNFYSFSKEQEINFLAKRKETYDYYGSKSGDQITKIAGFIGENASGKTNVMRLFSFISYFICRNIGSDTSLIPDIGYKTFFNNTESSSFYIEFETKGFIYYYDVSLRKNIVQKESLRSRALKKGAHKKTIFLRKKDSIKELDEEHFKNIFKNDFPKIREDVSFITFIKKSPFSINIINDVFDYFLNFKTNINEFGQINYDGHKFRTLKMYLEDADLRKRAEEFIRNFDLGLDGFEIKEEERDDKSIIAIQGIHSSKMPNKRLQFIYESRGTQSLFFTMANILSALKTNSVVIVDEIEFGFHPEALNKLISFFINENEKGDAQLIFSSHSLGFMNKLDMHQIFLVDKNMDGESNVRRLNTVEGIRSDENFLSKYMSGAYGAFPKIRV